MKRIFMRFSGLMLAVALQFIAFQAFSQTEGSGIVIRVIIDGVATDYYEGACGYGTADWGGKFSTEFCADPKWGHDIAGGTTPDSLGCDSIPAGQLTGKVAMIRRGTCGFSIKALNAQKAGAVACLIAQIQNTTTDDCYVQSIGVTQPQGGQVTIPCLFVCRQFANQIDAALKAGKTPQICFVRPDVDIISYFFPVTHKQTPVKQIDHDSLGFSVDVLVGGAVERTNVKVNAKVLKNDGTVLYTASATEPTVAPGDTTRIIVPGLYAPELPIGTYRVAYDVVSDPVGGVAPIADKAGALFYVTDKLFAQDDGATIGYRPGTLGSSWAAGNVYYMSPTALDKYKATRAEFTFATNASELPIADVEATIYLFKVKDDEVAADWSGFDRTDLISTTMDWLGTAAYEAPANMASYTLQQVDLIDLNTGNTGVDLENGGRYMLVCEYNGTNTVAFHAFDEDAPSPNVGTTVYTSQWFLGGFGSGINAVLRMYVDLVSTTDETPLPESVMNVTPNPVQGGNVNLAIQFDQPTDATITIAELSGRVIMTQDRQGLTNETLTYQLPQLSSGMYLARIATKEGTRTKKFMAQQ